MEAPKATLQCKEEIKLVKVLDFHWIPYPLWNPTLLNAECQSLVKARYTLWHP